MSILQNFDILIPILPIRDVEKGCHWDPSVALDLLVGPAAVAAGRLDLEDRIVLDQVRNALVVSEDIPDVAVAVLAGDQVPIDFGVEVAVPDEHPVDEDTEECSVVVAGILAEGHHIAAGDSLVVVAAAADHIVLDL